MTDKFVKFLYSDTIIKYVPTLRTKIKELKKKASKLDLPERNKIIYICYYLDDPHLKCKNFKSK